MTLNPTNIDRIRELCLLIANEHDHYKVQSLIEQLNLALDGQDLNEVERAANPAQKRS